MIKYHIINIHCCSKPQLKVRRLSHKYVTSSNKNVMNKYATILKEVCCKPTPTGWVRSNIDGAFKGKDSVWWVNVRQRVELNIDSSVVVNTLRYQTGGSSLGGWFVQYALVGGDGSRGQNLSFSC